MVCIEGIEAPSVHKRRKVGIAHLLNFAATGADQVSVGERDALILRHHPFKHMPSHDFGLNKQLHRVINGRAADAEAVAFDQLLQLFDREMAIDAHDVIQDSVTLRRFPHIMSVEIVAEPTHNGICDIGIYIYFGLGFHRCDKSTTFFGIEQRFIARKKMFTFSTFYPLRRHVKSAPVYNARSI